MAACFNEVRHGERHVQPFRSVDDLDLLMSRDELTPRVDSRDGDASSPSKLARAAEALFGKCDLIHSSQYVRTARTSQPEGPYRSRIGPLMRLLHLSGIPGHMNLDPILSETTGARLRKLRERAGMGVRELARTLGKKVSTYSDYESDVRGFKPLPVELVQGLIPVLLGRGDPPILAAEIIELAGVPVVSERMERIIKALESLPTERIAAYEQLILSEAKGQ